MILDAATLDALADAVAERLRPMMLPPGWPEGRGCISESEAAQFLSIGAEFLRELRVGGKIECTRQGRRITYSPHNIAEYLSRCRSNGDAGR